jgi:hypothetical protein
MDALTVEAAPRSITRAQYTALIEAAGFAVADVVSLEFRTDGIYALVFARNEDGKRTIDHTTNEINKHRVFVPVRD